MHENGLETRIGQNVVGKHLHKLARGPSCPSTVQRVGSKSCTHFSSDPLGLRRKLHSYPRADVVKVLRRNRLFVVCFHNSSALWEILYGCLSLLTGLFHCAFVIVINAEVLPEVWPHSQTAQQCELCLIFSINKQGSSRALSFPKTLSWVRKWVWASPHLLQEMPTLVAQGLQALEWDGPVGRSWGPAPQQMTDLQGGGTEELWQNRNRRQTHLQGCPMKVPLKYNLQFLFFSLLYTFLLFCLLSLGKGMSCHFCIILRVFAVLFSGSQKEN